MSKNKLKTGFNKLSGRPPLSRNKILREMQESTIFRLLLLVIGIFLLIYLIIVWGLQ